MKSLVGAMTAALFAVLLMTAAGWTEDAGRMEEIKKDAEKAVHLVSIQLKQAVREGNRAKIALAAKLVDLAVANSAAAGNLLRQKTESRSMEHCSNIAYEVIVAAGYLAADNVGKAEASLAEAGKIAAKLPAPANPKAIDAEALKIKEEAIKAAEAEKMPGTSVSKADLAKEAMQLEKKESK